jgi:hypothetical protein
VSTQSGPGRWTVVRDVGTYLGGWALIFKQAGIVFDPPSLPSETMIWAAAAMIGGPGIVQLITWRFGTGGSPSGSEPPPSALPPTPSTSPSGGSQ